MVKTTIYLDADVARALRLLSQRLSKPQAALIRDAIRRFAASERPPLPEGLGMFESGYSDTTLRRKQILKQAAQNGKWR